VAVVVLAVAAALPARAELTFEEAVRTAVGKNERAGIARLENRAAQARVGGARSLFLPSVTLVGSYTRRSEEDGALERDALNGSATLNLTLFDARSIPLYRQAARAREATAAASANDLRLLSFETGNAYLQALGATQLLAAAERRVEHARLVLELSRARFQAQLARSNDVTRTELEAATAEQALTDARGQLQAALLSLGFLVGTSVAGPLVDPQPLLAAAAEQPRADVAAARARRLDVVAGKRRAEALHELAREPLMRYIPSVALSAQGRATNETGPSGSSFDGSLAVIATWRLFDGGLGLAERRERQAEAGVAELATATLARRVELEVANALVALESGRANLATTAVAVAAARKNVRETTELYRQGLTSALEVSDANVRLFDAEVAAIRARYTLALAYLDLRAAEGLDALGEEPRP
jgi:outer membrane protein TolC